MLLKQQDKSKHHKYGEKNKRQTEKKLCNIHHRQEFNSLNIQGVPKNKK